MRLTELLSSQAPILADGAMGTYFSTFTGLPTAQCERYNLQNPQVILEIHRQYRSSGAKLLRTNTFSANTAALELPLDQVTAIVQEGYRIAKEAAGTQAVVLADIGTIYVDGDESRDPYPEYCAIVDAFLAAGAESFLFETLSELRGFLPVFSYIKEKKKEADILVSFSLSPDGRTRSGIPLGQLLEEAESVREQIAVIGLNCGCGPTHLRHYAASLSKWAKKNHKAVMVLPNAGYPSIEQQRTVFNTAPSYFAEKTAELASAGVQILGGCCGTTPEHIRLLAEKLGSRPRQEELSVEEEAAPSAHAAEKKSSLQEKLEKGEFVLAAELDPPYGSDLSKLIHAAQALRQGGCDLITISDSPLARAKMDAVVCAARLKRESGLDVLPHVCCRDKNVNALRAALLGAHSEGIRAVLSVTGDHVPEADRGYVKPVFNLSSIRLMELIRQMNLDVFQDGPILIGGALNPNTSNDAAVLERVKRKIEAGARFFLTQPVFEERFELIDQVRALGARVLVGIMPLVSYRNASYMSNEVPGVSIPPAYLQRFRPDMERAQAAAVGVSIGVELAKLAKPHADGFYLMTPFNRADITCAIVSRLREEQVL